MIVVIVNASLYINSLCMFVYVYVSDRFPRCITLFFSDCNAILNKYLIAIVCIVRYLDTVKKYVRLGLGYIFSKLLSRNSSKID